MVEIARALAVSTAASDVEDEASEGDQPEDDQNTAESPDRPTK